MIGRNIAFAEALKEIEKPVRAGGAGSSYDLIISGAGMAGFYIALEAARQGMKVLITDRRTTPGYDIASKRRLWLSREGIEDWDKATLDLFFPTDEQEEMDNTALEGPRSSRKGEEMLLFAGSLKKGMLRTLLLNGIDVLLMADVCGVLADDAENVCGVLVAMKQGVFSISGKAFVDASDRNFFTRDLFGMPYAITGASYVVEMDSVTGDVPATLSVPGFNYLQTHQGKKFADQYFVEFGFTPSHGDISMIEQQARTLAGQLSTGIHKAAPSFSKSMTRFSALECSFETDTEPDPSKVGLGNYFFFAQNERRYSCASILRVREAAREFVATVKKNSRPVSATASIRYAGGSAEYRSVPAPREEAGFTTSLSEFKVDSLKLEKTSTKLLVAGCGTAGTLAALAACREGAKPLVVEYFHDLGGTKTNGGVNDYYRGYQDHPIIKNLKDTLASTSSERSMTATIPRCHHYLQSLQQYDCRIITGAIICGALVSGSRLGGVVACVNGRLLKIEAGLTIDATGDADIAFLAGEKYHVGDSRMGITQDYSHWDIPFRPKVKDYNRDYDIIDNTQILETQRGLYLAHYEAHYYDFYPMQAIRESRRVECEHMIDIHDVASGACYEDTVARARSDYDPHYFANSEMSRCGFILPHFDNLEFVNIPYRALVPKHIDGLLMSGKAIGLSEMAFQFTRMSADVTVLGFVTGMLAADIIRKKSSVRGFDVSGVQKALAGMGYLPVDLMTGNGRTVRSIADDLAAGKGERLFNVCICNPAEAVPVLEDRFERTPSVELAKALAWFGSSKGNSLLVKELDRLVREERFDGHPSSYYEVYDTGTTYWKINSAIALLAMSGTDSIRDKVLSILDETTSGGAQVPAKDAYNAGRIDIRLVPCYNRIANLVFYIERHPDRCFAPGLERLLDDRNISGLKTSDYSLTRNTLYSANLEILIAAAAGRCGSVKGLDILIGYLEDIHYNFRTFARSELSSILKKDCKYDIGAWRKAVKSGDLGLTPLEKSIEF